MKRSVCALACSLFFAVPLAHNAAAADLVVDGTFTNVLNTGTNTYTFGEFGTAATSVTLTEKYWTTSGYNFVFAPNTADSGTHDGGANAGQPHEAPGQYNTGGYGNLYLFGAGNVASGGTNPGNGGLLALPMDPAGGNFVAADGAYNTKAINQTINGLTVGQSYAVSFYWAGAQQQGAAYTSATTESWVVGLANTDGTNSVTNTTTPVNVANKGFSGWMQQTYIYQATATSEVLSFLAAGTPTGQPPFSLLGGVSMVPVPEPATWAYFFALGAGGLCVEVMRRRRQKSCADTCGDPS